MLFHILLARTEFPVILSALAERKPMIGSRRHIKQFLVGNLTVNADALYLAATDNDIRIVLPEAHGTDIVASALVQRQTAAARAGIFSHTFTPEILI